MVTRKKTRRTRAARPRLTQASLLEAMHQIWLAGIGAASRAQVEGPKLLKELMAEGARVHAQTSRATRKAFRGAFDQVQSGITSRVDQVREQAGDAIDNLEKIFQTRVHRALTQIGVPSAEEIAALTKRVDALNANIDRLRHTRVRRQRRHPVRKNGEHAQAAAA
jgi:poly(hydroxyalkanoate) granule-associated protein